MFLELYGVYFLTLVVWQVLGWFFFDTITKEKSLKDQAKECSLPSIIFTIFWIGPIAWIAGIVGAIFLTYSFIGEKIMERLNRKNKSFYN